MGGRCAEEICLGEMTTGAGNDIERATEMARKMVCEWGMSEKMGPLTYGSKEEQVFLGRGMSSDKNFSDETAKLIDQEVKALVMGGYNRATELLQNNRSILENLAQALLEKETLNAIEVNNIVDGKSYINPDESGGKSEEIKPEVPVEKLKTKTDPEEGLLGGGGMPDPTPA
jgi:cell division protease FtsH